MPNEIVAAVELVSNGDEGVWGGGGGVGASHDY